MFTVFDRDALIEEFRSKLSSDSVGVQKFKAERSSTSDVNFISIEDWDAEMTSYAGASDTTGSSVGSVSNLTAKYEPVYADEILPFDITITMANEMGQRATLAILGVELLNEGMGFSIDSVSTEKAYTFVARKVDYMRSLDSNSDAGFSSTY